VASARWSSPPLRRWCTTWPPRPPRVAWCGSRSLAYAAVTRTDPVESEQLFRIRADGTRRGPLASFEPNTEIPWLQSRGTTLTFEVSCDRRGLATMDAVDLSSGSQTQLSRDTGNDQSPTLAPDGAWPTPKACPCTAVGPTASQPAVAA
jgi:Tol biopolymer transport system component